MKTFIDPPSGWKYGFPKEFPENVTDVKSWLIENGYPKKEIDCLGEYFFCRYFKQGDVNISDDFQIGPDGAYEHDEKENENKIEISDDDIQKGAEENTCYIDDFIKGAKWYREQLKSRQ